MRKQVTITKTDHRVFIEENAPRDGLQNEAAVFSLEEKVSLVDSLTQCGFPRIQVGAFVDPRKVPQMADTEKLLERIARGGQTIYSALVLNERGMERAAASGIGHVSFFVSASDAHSRRNTNLSAADALHQARKAVSKAVSRGISVQGGIMNAFTCPLEGVIPLERVLYLVCTLTEMGVEEVNLADTAGLAHPLQVTRVVQRVLQVTEIPVSLHLHDSLGFGLVNAYAAWNEGIRRFDASCGGLGGCPFLPQSAGNIASEDMVNLFESMGVSTGISLPRLVEVARMLRTKLNRPLWSRYLTLCGSPP